MSVGTKSTVRLLPTDDSELWDRLVAATAGGTAFHDWSWLDLHSELAGVRTERLLVLDGDEPVGVFPISRKSKRSMDSYAMPFPFVGPVVPPQLLVPTLRAFRRRQVATGPVLGRFEFGPDIAEHARPALRAAGVGWKDDSTVVLDISHGSTDELRANFSAMRRKSIRRAERRGASARESRPGEVAELLPKVLDAAYRGRGKPSPYSDQLGSRIEQWSAARDDVYSATALVDGELAGVLTILAGHPTAMLWAGSCLPRFRDSDPNVLLHQHVFDWAIGHGNTAIDFAGIVDEGVLRFKLAFGGAQKDYLSAESLIGPSVFRRAAQSVRSLRRG